MTRGWGPAGLTGTGSLRNISGNNTWTGAVTLGSTPGATIQSDAGLLTVPSGADAVRWLPPLNVRREEIDEAVEIFRATLAKLAT